jgi:hypothetical protein
MVRIRNLQIIVVYESVAAITVGARGAGARQGNGRGPVAERHAKMHDRPPASHRPAGECPVSAIGNPHRFELNRIRQFSEQLLGLGDSKGPWGRLGRRRRRTAAASGRGHGDRQYGDFAAVQY